jgi:hypothetical protein
MMHVEPGLWSHAAVRLELPETLVLDRLASQWVPADRCSGGGTPGAGETVTLECFDPQAEIAVVVDLPDPQVQVRRGTTVTVGETGPRWSIRPTSRRTGRRGLS